MEDLVASFVAPGSQSQGDPNSILGKSIHIPRKPHGEWLTISRGFKKKSRSSQKDKGKAIK